MSLPAHADPNDYDVVALRRALWDIFVIAGGDTDGDQGSEATLAGLRQMTIDAVRELREDYNAILDRSAIGGDF